MDAASFGRLAADYFTSSSGWSTVLYWWFCLLLPAIVFVPLTARLARRQFDAAWPLAKVMSIVLPAYGVWLLARFHVMDFSRTSIVIVLLIFAMVGLGVAWRDRRVLREARFWRIIALEEALFLVVLTAWGLLRFIRPDIYDIEKPMNLAFINACLISPSMAPPDPWFALGTINYYYFGHFFSACMIRLSGVGSSLGYNLVFITLPAMVFVLVFSIVANGVIFFRRQNESQPMQTARPWRAPIAAGLVSALLVVVGGNLHVWSEAILPSIWNGPASVDYYWASARDYIGDASDKTIAEFPAYSFILGDLHAHVMDLMLVLAIVLGLLFFLCRVDESAPPTSKNAWRHVGRDSVFLVPVAWLLGLTLMTNTWDFPIYWGLAALVVLLRNLRRQDAVWKGLVVAAAQAVTMACAALLVAWPYAAQFIAPVKKILFVTSHSPLRQLAVVYGYQFALAALLVIVVAVRYVRGRKAGAKVALADGFFLLCLLMAAVCIAVPEVVYIKDIYAQEYHRSNTMFKFSLQAFALLAMLSGYCAFRTIEALGGGRWRRWIVTAGLGLWLALPLAFAWYAVGQYYLKEHSETPGLDGLAYMKRQSPDDYQIAEFLNRQAPPGNIVEADGLAYTPDNRLYGRISIATGRSTILGWRYHEKVWRNYAWPGLAGGIDDVLERRHQDVLDIYTSPDEALTRRLLDQYQVRYIVIGPLERVTFDQLNEAKLRRLAGAVLETPQGMLLEFKAAR